MRKIVSQLAGAAAVVAAASAGFAYAQSTDPARQAASAPIRNGTAGTVYEGGVNNGSTYVRSNELGNASAAERPAPAGTRTSGMQGTDNRTSTAGSTGSTSTMDSSTSATPDTPSATPSGAMERSGTAGNPDLSNASNTGWNADGSRAARADRN